MRGVSRTGWPRRAWVRCIVGLALVALASGPAAAHPKTDVVRLKNGDHFMGDVKGLQNGILSLSTDAAGTIGVEWTHIASVVSKYDYQIQTVHGDRYYGTLAEPDKPGQLRIAHDSTATDIAIADVVFMAPIKHGFWKRMDGSFNLGLSYTQSNQAVQFSFSGNTHIRTLKVYNDLQWNSIFNTQEGGESAQQESVIFQHTRFITRKISSFGTLQVGSNPSQGYDFRTTVGGGMGRALSRKFISETMVVGGLVYIRETVTDSPEVNNSAALMAGLVFGSFSYDHPKRTVTTTLNTFTNVTDTPRFRAQLNLSLTWQIINDFNVSISIYDSYDSRPPTTDATSNDLSFVTSIGYSF